MSTRKERVSNTFMRVKSSFVIGQDARAHELILQLVETEVRKALENKK